ncbi:MAG: hypothetical protein MR550_02570 [Bacilli bacterium]|nr:hypothetical protein [Bacilli bacterium]
MNIKYYETLVEENKKEIKHLNLLLSELEENKRNIFEKEYIYEVGRINYYLEKEEEKLEENKLIINSYKIIINELKQIEKLKEYKINDKYDKEQYEYELNKRNEIIEYYKKNIPSTLYIEIEKEITKDKIEENNNTKEEKSDVQEKKENNKNNDVILLSSSTEELNTSKESIENRVEEEKNNVVEDKPKSVESNVILLPSSTEELNHPKKGIENKEDEEKALKNNIDKNNLKIVDSNVILLPSSSNEQPKNIEPAEEIKKGIKYDYKIEEITDNQNNLNNKTKETNKKNNENNNDNKDNTDDKTNEDNKNNKLLKIEEIHNANPTLKSKVIEKVRKYGIQALVIISTGAVLSLAINPTAAFYIVGFGSIIGLNIKSRINEKANKKTRKKGKYLKK